MSTSTPFPMTIFDHTFAAESGAREVVHSRFGELVIDMRNALTFPKGLLGMPSARNFVLTHFPSERMQQFKLLQCLDDLALSFITLPLGLENAIIRSEHAREGCRVLGISDTELVMLLIVCVHRGIESTRLSVNARAPVLIDASKKIGAQYVLPYDMYKVQHFIT